MITPVSSPPPRPRRRTPRRRRAAAPDLVASGLGALRKARLTQAVAALQSHAPYQQEQWILDPRSLVDAAECGQLALAPELASRAAAVLESQDFARAAEALDWLAPGSPALSLLGRARAYRSVLRLAAQDEANGLAPNADDAVAARLARAHANPFLLLEPLATDADPLSVWRALDTAHPLPALDPARLVGLIVAVMLDQYAQGSTTLRVDVSQERPFLAKLRRILARTTRPAPDHGFVSAVQHALRAASSDPQYHWGSRVVDLNTNETWANHPGGHWAEWHAARGAARRLGMDLRPLPSGWADWLATLPLDASQQAALTACWRQPLTLVTGAAGSGKTTLIRYLVEARDRFSTPDLDPIAGVAPTGKAADRLRDAAQIPATTVHQAFRLTPSRHDVAEGALVRGEIHTPITEVFSASGQGWLVVDESSMLDVWTALAILWGTSDWFLGHVVFLGDPHQLPPVGPGQPFRDLIRLLERRGLVAHLTGSHRDLGDASIQSHAALLLPQHLTTAWAWSPAIHPLSIASLDDAVTAARAFIDAHGGWEDVQGWQILCPVRSKTPTTPWGADEINAALAQGRPFGSFAPGDRVIQTVNNYDTHLMNGVQARVTQVEEDFVTVEGPELPGGVLPLPRLLAAHELAWAWTLTVHKAQGSEWPAVLILIPPSEDPDSPGFLPALSLVYTALTRARQTVILAAPDPDGWIAALRTTRAWYSDRRRTALGPLLAHLLPELPAQTTVVDPPATALVQGDWGLPGPGDGETSANPE